MRTGISLQPISPTDDPARVLRVAREAERLGFDSVYMSGHVLEDPNGTVLDPLITLAAVAGATERIRLATSVLILPHYNPVLLANEAASLDVLSAGRFTMAVGVGWNEEEFAALGVPFKQRGARADEHLEVLRALWSERPTNFEGRFTTLRETTLGIEPLTPGGPPIWVCGHSDAALRRALRFGAAWHGTGATPEEVREIRARIQRIAAEVGRDPASLDLNGIYFVVPPVGEHNGFLHGHLLGGTEPTGESVAADIEALEGAGLTALNLLIPLTSDTFEMGLAWVASEVLPRLRQTSS